MSAELLRRAAALMRERANDATGSPWQHIPTEDEAGCSDAYVIALTGHSSIGEDVGESMTPEDAQHIASWHPAVALAVADWLEDEADQIPPGATHAMTGGGMEIPIAEAPAVRAARAYLGADR